MSKPELWQQYGALLEKADFIITYSALSDEIPVEQTPHFEIIKNKPTFIVPPTNKIEPKDVADKIISAFATCTLIPVPCPLIFLPGQKFDLTGARHGRGFGWYDKLLAELPNEWIRIGVAKENQISQTPLKRNLWDQPIDWLLWQSQENSWKIIETKERDH